MDSNPASSWQDSGYGSQPASPVGQPAKISQKPCHSATDTCDNSRGRLLKELQTYGDIFEFDKPVDDSVISRFQRIQTRIEIPLLNYIHEKRPNKKYSPIAVRLMVLGRTAEAANPSIVILCSDSQAKVVKKFVNKDNFRALSRPQDQDLPSFDVYVVGRALEMKQSGRDYQVFTPLPNSVAQTYLGAPITVHLPSGADKRTTLGGVLAGVLWNGQAKLYGLTVGHVLEDEDSDDWEPVTISMPKHKASPFDISGDSSSSTSSDVSDSNSSSSSPDDAISRKTASIYATRKNKLESSHTQKPWMDPALRPLGYISEYSLRPGLPCIKSRYGNPQPYYDWALLDMHEYRRNEIPLRTRGWFHGIFWPEEIDITAPRKISNNRPVFVITGSEGRMRGSLSTLPSRVLLGKSQVFVNAFLLNADNVIKDGDSGSWVVDQETRQVYGYVVATDAFGDAYVIPMAEALQDIQATLGLRSIRLADHNDIKVWSTRNQLQSLQPSKVITNSPSAPSKGYRFPTLAFTNTLAPTNKHTNCLGQEVCPTLMNDCPEEERFIIESRWNHRYKRGLDMWSSIQHDFSIRFNKSPEIDSLQTKFQRARSRYIKWLPEDEEILREACNTMERRKYQHLLEMFYDMGGSKNMRLNAEDIKDKVEKDIKEDELLCEEIDEVVRKAEAERLNMERDNPEEPMDVNLDRATNYDKDKGTAKIYQGTA